MALLAGSLAFGQKHFEVASVRPVEPNNQQVTVGLHLDGQQARVSAFSVRDMIGMAYNVRPVQISGPEWLASQRFELNATLPSGATMDDFSELMQSLLSDRFGLKFHKDQKEFQVYVLERGKKPLALKPTKVEGAIDRSSVTVAGTGSSQGVSVDLGGGASYTFANGKFEGKKLDMPTMVDTLAVYMNLPVVNQTNLDGFYDISFELAPDDYRAMLIRAGAANGMPIPTQALQFAEIASTPSLFEAIDNLGLKMDTRKVLLDVIVVEQISKAPTEN